MLESRLLKARRHWYPIMLDLHRFMIAVARVSVNHDGKGGTAPDPLVWDQGSGILILLFFLHLSLCSSRGCQAHDAPHHGRSEPDGELRGEILADLPVVLNHRCLWFRLQNLGFSAVAVHQGRRHVLQRLLPMVLVTIEIPQFRVDKVVDLPSCRSCRFPVVVQRQIPMVVTVCRTK